MKEFIEPVIEVLNFEMIDVIASSWFDPNAGEEDEF